MTQPFLVTATGRFERELKKLAAYHPTLPGLFRRVIDILKADPYNRSRRQSKNIQAAQECWADYKRRKKQETQ